MTTITQPRANIPVGTVTIGGVKYEVPIHYEYIRFLSDLISRVGGSTGVVSAASGGTGFSSYTKGDILAAATATSFTRINAVATGNALISGGVGQVPAWGKIDLTTHVSGVLDPSNGGTGFTTFGTGVRTWLQTPTSANLAAAVSDETGTGSLVFANGPTFVAPSLGTPASGVLTNCTGYPSSALSGIVSPANGGTGVANNAASTLTISGAFASTFTITGVTSVTFPTSGTLATTSQLPVGANPTASVGLTAVNGSAATFLRSDGAPALSQSIVPTWTGAHVFNSTVAFNGGTTIGDASGDALTINSSTASIPNNINFNGNVGLGTAPTGVPATRLVVGDGGGDEGATIFPGTGGTASLHFSDTSSEKGSIKWAASTGALRLGAGGSDRLSISTGGQASLLTAGAGLSVTEGSNCKQGIATLVAGTVTVSNTSVTASSRIFLTPQNASGTAGSVSVTARTAGTSFTIGSTSALDTRDVAYLLMEPA